MTKNHYIDAKCFEDFKTNQEKLIVILNHSVTTAMNDIIWIKRFIGIMTGLIAAIFLRTLII